jgi:hypothetical protein
MIWWSISIVQIGYYFLLHVSVLVVPWGLKHFLLYVSVLMVPWGLKHFIFCYMFQLSWSHEDWLFSAICFSSRGPMRTATLYFLLYVSVLMVPWGLKHVAENNIQSEQYWLIIKSFVVATANLNHIYSHSCSQQSAIRSWFLISLLIQERTVEA